MIIKASVVDGAAMTAPYCPIKRGLLGAHSFPLPLQNSGMHCGIWSFLNDPLLAGSSVLKFGVRAEAIGLGLSGRKGNFFKSTQSGVEGRVCAWSGSK